jgi:hypothetical protein
MNKLLMNEDPLMIVPSLAYLRPETLFGTKFESYQNKESGRKAVRAEAFKLED